MSNMVLRNAFLCLAAAAAAATLTPAAFAAPGARAHDRAALYAACLAEAKRPLIRNPAYRNGSMRDREVLANSYVPAVRRGEALCVQAEMSPSADTACQPAQGDAAADDHTRRLGELCRAMTALPR
jgi:hypothetical protein